MRAAALLSVAIIAIGAYLMIAAALALSATWIAIGALAIAVTVAIAIVSAEPRSALSR
jgi:hypothetical protein